MSSDMPWDEFQQYMRGTKHVPASTLESALFQLGIDDIEAAHEANPYRLYTIVNCWRRGRSAAEIVEIANRAKPPEIEPAEDLPPPISKPSRRKKAQEIPHHEVPRWDALIPAVLDLIWRMDKMPMVGDLLAHLTVPGDDKKKAAAMIHKAIEAGTLRKKVVGRTKSGKPIERIEAAEEQRGRWYVVDKKGAGKLWTETELAHYAQVSRIGLRKRLQRGMTVKEAVTTIRKNDGRRVTNE